MCNIFTPAFLLSTNVSFTIETEYFPLFILIMYRVLIDIVFIKIEPITPTMA